MAKKNKIIIIYSSHLPEEKNKTFNKHVSDTIGVDHDIYCFPNFNQFSLNQIYNKGIDEYHDDNAVMVFCHNDIHFRTKDWGKKLLIHFNTRDYQIIGVAGTTHMPETGRWWDRRERMMGIVDHTNGISEWTSEYCKPFVGVKPAVIIDGLFMAVDTSDIEHKFDEEFKGFHFYDLSFCYPNFLDGCNIGVITDIRIKHDSMGATNNEWELNRRQFVEKYKEELPYDLLLEDNK